MDLSQKLAKLELLANKLGYRVVPSNENQCSFETKTIEINTRQRIEKRIFVLAHELGHVKTYRAFFKEFGEKRYYGNTRTWPVLESELRAWAIADRLIRKLDLYNADYLKCKHTKLRAYYCYTNGEK